MSEPAPAISVIVPAYGVADLLGEALASIQAQSFADWEAIVVDDGMGAAVAAAAAPFQDDPRIKLLQTDNGGVSLARNRAIHHAKAPLIALLDGDDIYEPEYLATMIAAIEADPGLGFVSCDATYFGAAERAGQRFSQRTPQSPPVTLDRVLRREFNCFTACTLRRAAFDAIGGFDATLRTAEDFDLWIRLLEAGWGGAYVPLPLVRYRRRPGSLSSQTLSMMKCVVRVYRGAAARMAGRPEAAIADAMRATIERAIAHEEGDALVRAGKAREGIALLRQANLDGKSLRWRVALGVMRAAPVLARPILEWRARANAGS